MSDNKYETLMIEQKRVVKIHDEICSKIYDIVREEKIHLEDKIKGQFFNIFPEQKVYRKEDLISSYYKDKENLIEINFNIKQYLTNIYKNEFKTELFKSENEDKNSSVYFEIRYNLIDFSLSIKLTDYFYENNLVEEELRKSTDAMFEHIQSKIKEENIEFDDLSSKFQKTKDILNNWHTFYVAEKLSEGC